MASDTLPPDEEMTPAAPPPAPPAPAPFDLSSALAPALDKGAFMQLTSPDGSPLFDANKVPVGITMRARNSSAGLAAMRASGNRRMDEARRVGRVKVTVESNEAEGTETLVACTVGWTFSVLDGQPFPFSEDNARRLWSDDRFRRWRDLAEDFVASEANFTKA